jgi:hypothetical protein
MMAGIHSAIDNEVASAVHAIIHRMRNTKHMFITPIWPITTLAGNRDLEFAAFMMLGPKKEDPNPAHVNVIERMTRVRDWFFVPITLTAAMPTRKDPPDDKDATFVNCCIEKRGNKR